MTAKRRDTLASMLAVVLLAVGIGGCKSVHAELVIPAEPSAVWAVLMDGDHYGEWNPVLVRVEGDFVEGQRLTYQMMDSSGTANEVEARVIRLDPERELNQYGGIPGVLTFDHHWLLEAVDGGTRVAQHEDYRGVGVLFWDPSWFESAYGRGNEALRDRVVRSTAATGGARAGEGRR